MPIPPADKQINVEVHMIDICLKQIHSEHIMHTNQLVRITYTIQQRSCLANKLKTCQHSQFDNLNFSYGEFGFCGLNISTETKCSWFTVNNNLVNTN